MGAKLTKLEDLRFWLESHQKQDAKYVYWSLYDGSEVSAGKMLHVNKTHTDAKSSNELLLSTIEKLSCYGADLTIHLKDEPKGSSGFKVVLHLLPKGESVVATPTNFVAGINGASIGDAIQKEVDSKVKLYELTHKIADLEAKNKKNKKKTGKKSFIQGIVKDFVNNPTFNSVQALELGLNIGHRILGFIESQFSPQVGKIAIAGMDNSTTEQPTQPEIVQPEVIEPMQNKDKGGKIPPPDINNTLISLQSQWTDVPIHVVLAGLNDFLTENPLFKPVLKSQLQPILDTYEWKDV